MKAPPNLRTTIAAWSRLGLLFGGQPARVTPDLERLLLETARLAPTSARLFTAAVTWVSLHSAFIARHRLKHLVESELDSSARPVLGLLIDLAVKEGASAELRIVTAECRPFPKPRPLFEAQDTPALRAIARRHACAESRRWRVWSPPVKPSLDAVRPLEWVLRRNPGLADRAVRKGDLRCSILESLRRDVTGGWVESEVALAAICSANRIAVRHALDDLATEGYPLRDPKPGTRNIAIRLPATVRRMTA